jgi:AcrR family transcriptional regulator
MVELILDATARVLIKEGLARTTTNRVAECAGISIGSLYQYFPGREALVAAVARRHSDQLRDSLRNVVAETAELCLRDGVARMIAAVSAAHAANPKLHRALAEEVPRLGALDWKTENTDFHAQLIRALLDAHGTQVRQDLDRASASFLIAMLAESAMNAGCRKRGDTPDPGMLGREILSMILRYVSR